MKFDVCSGAGAGKHGTDSECAGGSDSDDTLPGDWTTEPGHKVDSSTQPETRRFRRRTAGTIQTNIATYASSRLTDDQKAARMMSLPAFKSVFGAVQNDYSSISCGSTLNLAQKHN